MRLKCQSTFFIRDTQASDYTKVYTGIFTMYTSVYQCIPQHTNQEIALLFSLELGQSNFSEDRLSVCGKCGVEVLVAGAKAF